MTYEPHPIDTAHVKLSKEIVDLTERLAENSHDVWARQRVADGWKFGPARTTPRKNIPAWCRTISCPNPRSNTIATRLWKPSRRCWRSGTRSSHRHGLVREEVPSSRIRSYLSGTC